VILYLCLLFNKFSQTSAAMHSSPHAQKYTWQDLNCCLLMFLHHRVVIKYKLDLT